VIFFRAPPLEKLPFIFVNNAPTEPRVPLSAVAQLRNSFGSSFCRVGVRPTQRRFFSRLCAIWNAESTPILIALYTHKGPNVPFKTEKPLLQHKHHSQKCVYQIALALPKGKCRCIGGDKQCSAAANFRTQHNGNARPTLFMAHADPLLNIIQSRALITTIMYLMGSAWKAGRPRTQQFLRCVFIPAIKLLELMNGTRTAIKRKQFVQRKHRQGCNLVSATIKIACLLSWRNPLAAAVWFIYSGLVAF
jgi:hypothetical protein